MKQRVTRLLGWQILTVTLMVVGYSGYYLCRSNFSVVMPQLIEELTQKGLDPAQAKIKLGMIASLGVLGYAFGKFISGGLADFLGGRKGFLAGMFGAVVFTALFAMGGGMPLFTFAWIGNRLFQSMGWVGMIKITARWFSFSTYGSVMGVISLSYLFGDSISRKFMGSLIARGFDWRSIFYVNAAVLGILFLACFFLLKESPLHIGESEPPAAKDNLFGIDGEQTKPSRLKDILIPLFRSPVFWSVCLLSLGCTLIRETFNIWTPTYFNEVVGLTKTESANQSAWFPFFGGISVLIAGYLSDYLGRSGRAAIIFLGLLLSGVALYSLGHIDFGTSKFWPIFFVVLIAFLLMGPYSYLGGALALDFGGKQGSATVCGIIDGVGYLGGYLAGDSMARLLAHSGWKGAFTALSVAAAISSLPALLFFFTQMKTRKSPATEEVSPAEGFIPGMSPATQNTFSPISGSGQLPLTR